MRGSRPTYADVARVARVSTATVSYVLNDTPGQKISDATKKLVRDAATSLGYRTNLSARHLASGRGGVMLYVVPQMALNELNVAVGGRVTTELARLGIVLSLQFDTPDGANIVDAIRDLNPIAVTGIFPLTGAARQAAVDAGIPEIHLGSTAVGVLGPLNLVVGRLRIEHLVERGHRTVVYARSDDPRLGLVADFWGHGVSAAAAERGLPDVVHATVASDGSNIEELVRQWVDSGVDAVCAQSDDVAYIVLHGLRRAGLRCPADLAVMGVDADPSGAFADPPLTTVQLHADTIVPATVRSMLDELGYTTDPVDPPDGPVATIVAREST